jgi:hypothetical protein
MAREIGLMPRTTPIESPQSKRHGGSLREDPQARLCAGQPASRRGERAPARRLVRALQRGPSAPVGYRSPREFRKQLGTETTENAVGALVARRGPMEGFTGLDYPARVPEAFEALGHWQREGRLLQKEDVVFGLENASRALLRLFTGENFGKQLVKVADAAA